MKVVQTFFDTPYDIKHLFKENDKLVFIIWNNMSSNASITFKRKTILEKIAENIDKKPYLLPLLEYILVTDGYMYDKTDCTFYIETGKHSQLSFKDNAKEVYDFLMKT